MAGTLNFFQKITHPKVKRENVKNLWKNPCNIRDQSSMTLWNLPLLLLMFRFVCVCAFFFAIDPGFFGGEPNSSMSSESKLQVGWFRLQWRLAYSSRRRINHWVSTPMKRIFQRRLALCCCVSRDFLKLFFGFWGQLLVHFDHFLDSRGNWNRVPKTKKIDLWGSVWSESQEGWFARMAWGMEF